MAGARSTMSPFATKRAGPDDLRPGERALQKFWVSQSPRVAGQHLGEFERKVERGPQQELKDSGRVSGGAGWYGGYCLRAGPNPPAGPAVPALSIKRLRGPLCNHRVLGERITVDRLQEEKSCNKDQRSGSLAWRMGAKRSEKISGPLKQSKQKGGNEGNEIRFSLRPG